MHLARCGWIVPILALAFLAACKRQQGNDDAIVPNQSAPASVAHTALPDISDPVTVEVETGADALAAAHNQTPDSHRDARHAEAASHGSENSECSAYGRQSAASSKTDVKWTRKSPMWITLSMNASAYANGGHYRTCSFCAANECVGRHGNYTVGRSEAIAESIVTISFDTNVDRPPDYQLLLSPSADETSINAIISGPDMEPAKYDSTRKEPFILLGKRGAIYKVKLRLIASARDEGGCCNKNQRVTSVIDVRVTRAPILVAGAMTGYIVGGTRTTGYKNVGAFRLAGEAHCSGTVIGPRTVLTAAHCVAGYEDRVQQMDFILGSNINYPEGGAAFAIDRWDYPRGNPAGFVYDPRHFDDDIAIVYLKKFVPVTPAKLYQGNPTWQTVRDTPLDLQFVGFGFNKIDGETVAAGVKREAAWRIADFTNRTISFSVPGKNTCHGDSGGPAFLETGGQLMLAGVTSKGDDDCTKGIEMRIDSYQPWLKGRVN